MSLDLEATKHRKTAYRCDSKLILQSFLIAIFIALLLSLVRYYTEAYTSTANIQVKDIGPFNVIFHPWTTLAPEKTTTLTNNDKGFKNNFDSLRSSRLPSTTISPKNVNIAKSESSFSKVTTISNKPTSPHNVRSQSAISSPMHMSNISVLNPSSLSKEEREILYLLVGEKSFPYCSELFSLDRDNNSEIIEIAKDWYQDDSLYDTTIAKLNCSQLNDFYYLPESATSLEEAEFPIAYVIMVYKYADRVARLLQSIYWPQNVYCIHVDADSTQLYQDAVKNIVECFPSNVFIASRLEKVVWGGYGVLKGTINCFADLSARPEPWNYVLLYSGTDFPLKTNWELVQILKVLNGSQDSSLILEHNHRWIHYFKQKDGKNYQYPDLRPTPPFGMTIYKGMYQVTLSHSFVDFVVNDHVSNTYFQWLEGTLVSDEVFFATLIHNQHISAPGSFPGSCLYYYEDANTEKPYISRYQIWTSENCHSKYLTRGSCVFGVDDLPYLINREQLTAHKLYPSFEPVTLHCLAERLFNRTYGLPVFPEEHFDMEYYRNLPSVRYHNMNDDEKLNFTCI